RGRLDEVRPVALSVLLRLSTETEPARAERDLVRAIEGVEASRLLAITRELAAVAVGRPIPRPFVRRLVEAGRGAALGRPLAPALIALLQDGDPAIRAAAFDDLVGVAGRVPVEAVPALADHVDIDDFAREGLLDVGAPAAATLAARLKSE